MEGLSDPEVKLERAAAKEQRSRDDCPIENLMDIYFSPSRKNFDKAAYTAKFLYATKTIHRTTAYTLCDYRDFTSSHANKYGSND